MKILLLGGSNAGIKDGWAAQFAGIDPSFDVENRFLGAVGSLYGLMALMQLERSGAPTPDLVIFEYCLNDILLREAGVLDLALVDDALDAVMDFCARKGVGLLFLCLEPRPIEGGKPRKAIRRIQNLYAAAARRQAVPCLWLNDVIPEGLTPAHFQDENHLTNDSAGRVAGAVCAAVRRGLSAPAPSSDHGGAPFDYVDATQARAVGPCRRHWLTSRVFEGAFLEIARGGASYWAGAGRLAALMLRSNDMSGVYSIRSTNAVFRKTPRSQMQEVVRNLMLLHYVAGTIPAAGEVEIAMPSDEAALMRLPANKGLLEAPSAAPFEAQTLDIHGVIFWRRPSLAARLRTLLRSLR